MNTFPQVNLSPASAAPTTFNQEEEPAYKDGGFILSCCNGTPIHRFYNYLTSGPYYELMEEERVWEDDELKDEYPTIWGPIHHHTRASTYGSTSNPSTYPVLPPMHPRSSTLENVPQGRAFNTVNAAVSDMMEEQELARYLNADMKNKVAQLRSKNEFSRDELLRLPFKPMSFIWYIVELLFGTLVVGQYIITMLFALMVTAGELEKFPGDVDAALPKLTKTVLVVYPLLTMLLLLMASCEISMRKFMYYRLLTIGIIMDWDNAGVRKMRWFNWYFGISWLLMTGFTGFTIAATYKDRSSAAIAACAVIQIQTILLYSWYWNHIEAAERYLVTVNELMETAPSGAKALIDSCDVIRERDLAKAIVKLCRKLVNPMVSTKALVLDLATLRRERRVAFGRRLQRLDSRTSHQPDLPDGHPLPGAEMKPTGLRQWLRDMFESIFVVRLYASYFALLVSFRRVPWRRSKLRLWPYSGDLTYFSGLWVTTLVCYLIVLAIESYALYLAFRPNDMSRYFGSKPCKDCFRYLYQTGKSCGKREACSAVAENAANVAFCLGDYLLRDPETYYRLPDAMNHIIRDVCPIVWNTTKDFLLQYRPWEDTASAL